MSSAIDNVELIEETAFSMVVQALEDYRDEARQIFSEEDDKPADIAEDITREALDSMGVSSMRGRLYGKIDYKKAAYVFLPTALPIALMVDSNPDCS